ncbi:ion channel [Streptomyces sp. NPDC058579]|uniref:ion channel n=1 Tax=Streptomyces sp. NPDC058579 TaxID=3346548 RepID=UPI003663D6EC
MGDEDSQEPIVVEHGGRITPVDFVFWPTLGLLPALAIVPAFPRWLAYVCLGLGVLTTCALMAAASIAFTHENAWIEGTRIQISLMIGFFVIGQMMVFASGYYLLSSGVRGSFSQALTPASAVYFSVTAWTTTGFGDIHPTTSFAQILVVCELLSAVLTVTVVLATAVTKAFAEPKEAR